MSRKGRRYHGTYFKRSHARAIPPGDPRSGDDKEFDHMTDDKPAIPPPPKPFWTATVKLTLNRVHPPLHPGGNTPVTQVHTLEFLAESIDPFEASQEAITQLQIASSRLTRQGGGN